jgi:hypothetical protein
MTDQAELKEILGPIEPVLHAHG